MYVGDSSNEEGKVPFVLLQVGLGSRDAGSEPLSMREGYELVVFAVPHLNGNLDRGRVETPGLGDG